MEYRPVQLGDVPAVLRLYRQMLEEYAGDTHVFHYPRWDETTPLELGAMLVETLTGPHQTQWIGHVALMGHQVKGMAFGSLYQRRVGYPKHVGHCDLLYVDPKFRGGRGSKAIGVRLLRLLWTEAHKRVPEGLVIEGSYVPGSHGEKMWTKIGGRPYAVAFALTDAEGNARTDDLFRGHGAPVARMRRAG